MTAPSTSPLTVGSPPAPADETRPVHVLVADHEPAVRRNLARVLESHGMKVGVAEDAAQALAYVQRTAPDVALVDAMTPGGGLEVLARIRSAGAPCEVILMTSPTDVDSAVAAMKAGAYHFLTKPFHSSEAVAHAVVRAAEHRRLTERARRLEHLARAKEGIEVGRAVLIDLARLPYAEAKGRLVALFDETYTGELLRQTGGNMSEAARRAGLDRSNFRRLLKRHRET